MNIIIYICNQLKKKKCNQLNIGINKLFINQGDKHAHKVADQYQTVVCKDFTDIDVLLCTPAY